MFCPKCRSEYVEGVTTCDDCNIDLVEELEEESCEYIDPVKLISVGDNIEAEIILAKLRSEGIRAFKNYNGSDSYSMILLGRAILGVDIIVAKEDFEEAEKILQLGGLTPEDFDGEEFDENDEEESE